jgi:hypothetical protein
VHGSPHTSCLSLSVGALWRIGWIPERVCSSVGQSTRLISVGSLVQIQPDPPYRCCKGIRCSVGSAGAIAQLGEHLLCKQRVVGSIPTGSTIERLKQEQDSVFLLKPVFSERV